MRKPPGAAALQKVVKKTSQADIAKSLGVSQASVCRYLSGKQVPQAFVREAMSRLFGIDSAAWDTPRERELRQRMAPAPVEAAS